MFCWIIKLVTYIDVLSEILAVADVVVLLPLPDILWLLPEFELAAEPPDDGVDGTLAPPLLLPAPPPPDAPLACCPLTVDGPTPVINR